MKYKKVLISVIIILAGILLVSYNYFYNQARESSDFKIISTSADDSKSLPKPVDGKRTLVVFFSLTKGVYEGETLPIGNTHRVANYIQEILRSDIYEIVPATEYTSNYNELLEVAKTELRNNSRPALKGTIPDMSQYDVVFVGGPIWWGEYPMVVRTFLDQVDLNGKVVVPFTTHEGSGLGNTEAQLKAQYPNANVLPGIAIKGRDSASNEAKAAVKEWLQKIGML